MKNQVNKLKTYSLITFIKRFDINEMRNEFKTDFAFFTQFTPNKTAKKEVAHNKRKIKVSLVVYYDETFEC